MAPYKIRKEPDDQWSLEYRGGSASFKVSSSTWERIVWLMDEHAKVVRRLRAIFPDWPEKTPPQRPLFNRWPRPKPQQRPLPRRPGQPRC